MERACAFFFRRFGGGCERRDNKDKNRTVLWRAVWAVWACGVRALRENGAGHDEKQKMERELVERESARASERRERETAGCACCAHELHHGVRRFPTHVPLCANKLKQTRVARENRRRTGEEVGSAKVSLHSQPAPPALSSLSPAHLKNRERVCLSLIPSLVLSSSCPRSWRASPRPGRPAYPGRSP